MIPGMYEGRRRSGGPSRGTLLSFDCSVDLFLSVALTNKGLKRMCAASCYERARGMSDQLCENLESMT